MLTDVKLCHVNENALYIGAKGVFHGLPQKYSQEAREKKRFLLNPPKEVLHLDMAKKIAKYIFHCKT